MYRSRHRITRKSKLKPLCLALLLAMHAQAHGRQKEADDSGPKEETVLPATKVTARHGKEEAKDVPFGLSVLDGLEMESRRLYNLELALRSIPGVDINSWGGAGDSNIRIRGVGSLYQVSMDDSSVVLNVDGVSMSGRYASMAALDVERVEVLKGPQGTLFGRSSGAGAINVVTNKPTRHFEGHVQAEYGQDHQRMEEAVLSGPLSEQLSARFAIRESGTDNWITNLEDGKPLSKPHGLEFRGSLLWEPAAGTSALLTAERQDKREIAPAMVIRPYGGDPAVMQTSGLADGNKQALERYSLEVSHDLADSRVTSITAMTRMDTHIDKTFDKLVMLALYGMPMERLATDKSNEDVVSQEFRWQSLPGAEVFWVTGMNFFHSDRSLDSADKMAGTFNHDFKTDSYALYGEATYPLTARLKATAGLRYTWDHKTYDATYDDIATGQSKDRRHIDEGHATGRAGLSYAVTPQTNLYGTLAIGSKPGGFNDYAYSVSDSEPYKASRIYMGELGFKSELLDGNLSLNGALFFSKVRDDHLLSYDYQTMATRAVGVETRSRGVELEGRWNVNRRWSLGAAVSYLDAEITSDALGVSGGDVASGNRVPDVPRWSGNLNVRYQRNLPVFLGFSAPSLDAQLNYRLIGKRPADPQNHFDLDSYGKLDLRVSIINRDIELYVWGDNLLDDRYDLYGYYFTPTVQVGMPSRGRSVGAGLKWYL